jgi:hypothetical protein
LVALIDPAITVIIHPITALITPARLRRLTAQLAIDTGGQPTTGPLTTARGLKGLVGHAIAVVVGAVTRVSGDPRVYVRVAVIAVEP